MISGGAKFFSPSKCLEVNGATISASTGDNAASYAIDRNAETKWRSLASNDSTTETLTITFNGNQTIDRIFIMDHNWKNFVIQYDVSGTWTHFTSVTGIGGSLANLTQTNYSRSTAYYEFTPITTGLIRIQITTTQVANAEKYCSQIIATEELGTLVGYPDVKDVELDRSSRVTKTISGKVVVQKSIETVDFDLTFKNYPRSDVYNVDIDLMMALHDREDPFLVWLCGGRVGTPYFAYTLRGWRPQDLYLMQVTKAYKLGYTDNIYNNGLNAKVSLEESI